MVQVTVEQVEGMNQFGFHKSERGGTDRLGEVVIELGVDLIADAVHAILEGDRVADQELV
jgi:hypothetical protein